MGNPFIKTYVFYYGPVVKYTCDRCASEKLWELASTTEYYALLGLPIFKKKSYKSVVCPICLNNALLDPQEFRYVVSFALLNSALIEGKIGQREYKIRFADVEQQLNGNIYPLVNQAYKTAQEIKANPFAYFAQNYKDDGQTKHSASGRTVLVSLPL